jgi:hypothetical protein
MNAPNEKPATQVGMWAIVELFGHQRIAGFMTEHVIAGQGFVRIDVPEVSKLPGRTSYPIEEGGSIAAHSKLFGPGAIYAINPVDEGIARVAAGTIRHVPVQTYGLREALRNMPEEHRQRLLAGSRAEDVDDVEP